MPVLLQINGCANIASTGRMAEDIGDVAIANGWKSYIAYGRSACKSNSNLIKIGSKVSVLCHVLQARFFDRCGRASIHSTNELLKQIDRISPDVIQLHNLHGYFVNVPLLLNYIAKHDIPTIWTLHDCWPITGHCAHFALSNCNKWRTLCYDCPIRNEYPKSFIDNSTNNYNIKKEAIENIPRISFITGSKWMYEIAKSSFIGNRSINIIPHGIDIDIFQPREEANKLRNKLGLSDKFVILATGTSWEDYKGLGDFCKLRKELSSDYEILVVGLPLNKINDLPIGIRGFSKTNSPFELSVFYSMADCVMSLSRLESFGLTPVEGFACGTPAIVYNSTALPELITEQTGYVVEPGDIEDLKHKLSLLKQRGKRFYSESCRKIAVEKYNKKISYNKYISIYSKYINNI